MMGRDWGDGYLCMCMSVCREGYIRHGYAGFGGGKDKTVRFCIVVGEYKYRGILYKKERVIYCLLVVYWKRSCCIRYWTTLYVLRRAGK